VLDVIAKNNCENNIWVNFKLFGGIGLMLVFVVLQALMLGRYVEDKQRD
jgi:intracellular septation protein